MYWNYDRGVDPCQLRMKMIALSVIREVVSPPLIRDELDVANSTVTSRPSLRKACSMYDSTI